MEYTLDSLFSVRDKVVVVTGAAGGIGAELCRALAQLGAKVAICSRTEETLRRLEAEFAAEGLGENVLVVPANVAYEESVVEMMETVVERWGRIDGLINSAGITHLDDIDTFDMDAFRHVLDVNLNGTMICCKVAARYMIPQGKGRIINVSSIRGLQGKARYSAYAASKGAVNTLTKSLACELAPKGITVNALAPCFILTDICRDFLKDEKNAAWVLSRIPMGRLGDPADMVGPVLFLLSDSSAFVTGQILAADGGWTAG